MKKVFFICWLGTLLLVSAVACNHTLGPSSPASTNSVVKAKDLISPTPSCTTCCSLPDLMVSTATALPTVTLNQGTIFVVASNPNETNNPSDPAYFSGGQLTNQIFYNGAIQTGINPPFDTNPIQCQVSFSGAPVALPNPLAGGTATFLGYFNLPDGLVDTASTLYVGALNWPVNVCINDKAVTVIQRFGSPGCSSVHLQGGLFHGGINKVGFTVNAPSQLVLEYAFITTLKLVPPTLIPTVTVTPAVTNTFTPSPTPTCPGGSCNNGAVREAQSGQPWSGTHLDSSTETIGSAGCFLTCYSMISCTAGSICHPPDDLERTFDSDNLFSKKGKLMDPEAAAGLIGFNYAPIDFLDKNLLPTGVDPDETIANNVCQKATYVIAAVETLHFSIVNGNPLVGIGTHFVLVTGQESDSSTGKCRFTIDDPASVDARHGNFSPRHTFLDEYGPHIISARIFTR